MTRRISKADRDALRREYLVQETGSIYLAKTVVAVLLNDLDAADAEIIALKEELEPWHMAAKVEDLLHDMGFSVDSTEDIVCVAGERKEFVRLLASVASLREKVERYEETLRWVVECGTDYQSMNRARNALPTQEVEHHG